MTLITTVVSHRTVEIQTDPLAPPLIVTRTALIAASRAVQSSAAGLAEVKGRFPRLGAGHAFLDESQISQLVGDLNRAGVMSDRQIKDHPPTTSLVAPCQRHAWDDLAHANGVTECRCRRAEKREATS